jgi:hypothetical protein
MARKSINSVWGKPHVYVPAGPSSFEEVVKTLGLSPNEYEQSAQLKDWVQKNKDQKYVPPDLLQAWNMGG